MPQIVRTEIIEPAILSKEESAAVIDALYKVHGEIFAGVGRA
jgi:hypothetical protein